MFEDLIDVLKTMNGETQTYSFTVNTDDKGYFDRECPNKSCLKIFKVYSSDWNLLDKQDTITCPYCGEKQNTENWWTTRQIEEAKLQTIEKIKYQIHKAIEKDANNFNKKQKKGLITLQIKIGNMKQPLTLPLQAIESMEQEIKCESCDRKYAVIGSSYYCPFCGVNAVPVILKNSLKKIRTKIDNVDNIYNLLKIEDIDKANLVKSSLIETSFSELVTTFQKLCESIYEGLPNAALPLKKNVFQRIDDGASLWRNAIGKDYYTWLTQNEINKLKLFFQKRHILEHNQGIIDNDYLTKTSDSTYKLGQRLIVKKSDVLEFANLIQKLCNEILKYR